MVRKTSESTVGFDHGRLRRLADSGSFRRGESYFNQRRVHGLMVRGNTVSARVEGTRSYRVTLHSAGDEFDYSCNCPVGADGVFCKHCVAVALTHLEGPARAPQEPSVTIDDVRAHLASQKKEVLVDLLMERAADDERFERSLFMAAARKTCRGVDFSTYRRSLQSAIAIDDFVGYRESCDYSRNVDEVVDSVGELLNDGHAEPVIELAEYGLAALEEAIGAIDDSDGVVGALMERLQDIHLAACRKAKPDPEVLARRLLEWELRTEWDTFYGAVERYAHVLGAKGLALYRELAQEEWARVSVLAPGDQDPDRHGRRFRITSIMESLALLEDDVEALVAVKKQDLSHAYAFLQIAEIYQRSGEDDQALGWAVRGVEAFPERTDPRLEKFLAEAYQRCKRPDDAMRVVWGLFSGSPGLGTYRTLKGHASRLGQWPRWREKALALLRPRVLKGRAKAKPGIGARHQSSDCSQLVSVFLWEEDVDAAWQAANDGGCSAGLWLELAAKREKKHPEEALPIYQAEVELTLAGTNKQAYREAINLLRKVRRLMRRLGRTAEFDSYVETVRAAHKRKRNFTMMLSKAKWD